MRLSQWKQRRRGIKPLGGWESDQRRRGGRGAADAVSERTRAVTGARPEPAWAGARRPLGPDGLPARVRPARLFPLPRSPPTRRGSFRPPRRSGRCAPRPRGRAASPPSAPSLGPAGRRVAAPARRAASPSARLLCARTERVEGRDWWGDATSASAPPGNRPGKPGPGRRRRLGMLWV